MFCGIFAKMEYRVWRLIVQQSTVQGCAEGSSSQSLESYRKQRHVLNAELQKHKTLLIARRFFPALMSRINDTLKMKLENGQNQDIMKLIRNLSKSIKIYWLRTSLKIYLTAEWELLTSNQKILHVNISHCGVGGAVEQSQKY